MAAHGESAGRKLGLVDLGFFYIVTFLGGLTIATNTLPGNDTATYTTHAMPSSLPSLRRAQDGVICYSVTQNINEHQVAQI